MSTATDSPTPAELDDTRVRVAVYQGAVSTGVPPSISALSAQLGLDPPRIGEALERLALARALVLQPASREVLMANPFSAVPTPYAVRVGDMRYFGNCIWDGLGIAAMLRSAATIETSCACCGEAMALEVVDTLAPLPPIEAVVHFAVPARRWWDDIVYN